MNNYVSIALKIIGSLIILYIIFLIIVLCINTDNLKIKNSDKRKISEKYKKMAEKEENVYFVGRLANYKYFNMDQAIKNSLDFFKNKFT